MKSVRLQHLAGRRVRDANGKVIGRLHAIKAEIRGDECVITEFHLGSAALLERLGIQASALFGLPFTREPRRIAWDELDLSDPDDLRLLR